MALLRALLDVIVPVLLVAGLGALLGRRFPLDRTTITKISLNALTPALALQTLLTTKINGATALVLVGAFTAATLTGAALGWLALPGMPGRTRRSAAVAVAIGNNGNMGLPIALFALGQAGLDQSVILFIVSVVLTFLIAPLLYGADGGWRSALTGLAKMPTLWAMAAAVLVRTANIPVPTGVSRGIELLAPATLPMVLLMLGIQLGSSGRVHLGRAVLTTAACRVLVMPVIGLGLGIVFGLHGLELQSLVLALAMPTAVNAFLLAHEYDGDVEMVADTVTVGTVVSFATAAVVTAVLPWIAGL